jgi:hypothetical protein
VKFATTLRSLPPDTCPTVNLPLIFVAAVTRYAPPKVTLVTISETS